MRSHWSHKVPQGPASTWSQVPHTFRCGTYGTNAWEGPRSLLYKSTPHARRSSPAEPADNAPCIACGGLAGSCSVRLWLSGRPCCPSCRHPEETP